MKHHPNIKTLIELAKHWDQRLMLFSNSGSLIVVDIKTRQVLEWIEGIPNDGGDPGVEIGSDGREYLKI